MNCYTCSKNLINTKNCPNCPKKFCSETCLYLHSILYHSEKVQSDMKEEETNNNNQISPYMVKGFLNKEIKYESIYSLKNFVPVIINNREKLLGYGSFGKVFLSFNIINKKNYAIKHMEKKKIFKALHTLDTIYTEISIQSKIRHPNIVNILFASETQNSIDLVLEYAPKGNLFYYIQHNGYLSESKSFQFFIQIVNAIHFLHSNNYIHRDIKPENILLFENNVVKLCDFGWCVKLEEKQRTTYCGTTEYMAPEMINDGMYGKEIDNWSLGILLYEMLHGHSPFKPHKPTFYDKDVIENIRYQKSIRFNKQLSNECIDLINHLIEKNVKKRYNTEDIFNSKFVKNFEKMNYFFPHNNIIKDNKFKSPLNEDLKRAKNYYHKSIEVTREKDLYEMFSSECNSDIDEKYNQRKNIYLNKTFQKKEDIYNNDKYLKTIDSYDNNRPKINYHKKYLSVSQQKNKNINDKLKNNKIFKNKKKEEGEESDRESQKSLNTKYNFNNINIILCNNNLNTNLYSSSSNNIIINKRSSNNNNFISNYNKSNTLNINKPINNYYRIINKKNRNLFIDVINNPIKLELESENLIAKRIKIFAPKHSNIKEISRGREKISGKSEQRLNLIINNNNNSIKMQNLKNYFKSNIKQNEKNKSRNSFCFIENDNSYFNNKIQDNIKNQTIQIKKKLNNNKNMKKNNLKSLILPKNRIDDNEKIILNNDNNSIDEKPIQKNSENILDNNEIIKTPKKTEDNFQINPQILFNRLQKEINDINKKYNFKIPENQNNNNYNYT